MTTFAKNRLFSAIGVCAVVAGVALIGAIAASGDPIGRSVGALIGGGFAFGVLGWGLKEILAGRRGAYFAVPGAAANYAATQAVVVAMPPAADATASEFDDVERPAFAAVLSLTEAQVERQRSERRRQERKATLTRA